MGGMEGSQMREDRFLRSCGLFCLCVNSPSLSEMKKEGSDDIDGWPDANVAERIDLHGECECMHGAAARQSM